MFSETYCEICNENLILHADGSVACACGEILENTDERIPAHWMLSLTELRQARQEEADYAERA